MRKIAIDANRAIIEGAGIGRYTFEIIDNLLEADKENEYLLIFTHLRSDEQKRRKVAKLTRNGKIKSIHLPLPGGFKELLWGWRIPWYRCLLKGCDLFFAPSFFEVNMGLGISQVVAIHDLTPCLFPDQRGGGVSRKLCRKTNEACQKAVKVITISKSTKKDLIKVHSIDPDKIEVTYLGQKKFGAVSQVLPDRLKKRSYILSASTIEPRKNLSRLLKAFGSLDPKLRKQYPLVVAGAKGWNTGEIYDTLHKYKLEDEVIFLGYISDEMLASVYKNCLFFVYPSLYEGFGLPILEALSFGKAVLTSKTSSMPEVAGEAALLVDPQDEKQIADGLEKLITDTNFRAGLEAKSQVQANKFSWEKCAKETLKILNGINKS